MKKLGKKQPVQDPDFHATSQTIMPICYGFGQIGNCLILFFIFFLSFYYRQPLLGSEKILLSILMIPMSIGSSATSVNSVSFLIHQLNFPDEAVELFTQTMAVTLNFQVLLSIASVLTFIILVFYSYYGLLQINWRKLFFHLGAASLLFCTLVFGSKQIFHIADSYQNLYLDLKVADVISNPVPMKILKKEAPSGRLAYIRNNGSSEPFETILKTGILRVGFSSVDIPYSYWNEKNELAGFDICYAYQLARDLDCNLEFIPIDFNTIGEDFERRIYDIGMGAVIMTENRLKQMDFTQPYTEQDNVLIVPKNKRSNYIDLAKTIAIPHLKIGAIGGNKISVERHFPQAQLVEADDFSILLKGGVDAWLSTRTQAFIWCLSHPDFVVIDYAGQIGKRYFAYALPIGSTDWASFLNSWLTLKEQSGFKQQMYSYWVLGENPKERSPRWSILRNVLHWSYLK